MSRFRLIPCLLVAGGLLLGLGLYAATLSLTGNFHTILAGEVYRSGQPKAGDIARYAQHYGIRSVLNLRGENHGVTWYEKELAESAQAGITHYDYRLSAHTTLSPRQAAELIALMAQAPKPLLIHCQGGANRTGLAAALYLAAIARADEPRAAAELSIWYGDLPHWLDPRNATYEAFECLKPMLGYAPS